MFLFVLYLPPVHVVSLVCKDYWSNGLSIFLSHAHFKSILVLQSFFFSVVIWLLLQSTCLHSLWWSIACKCCSCTQHERGILSAVWLLLYWMILTDYCSAEWWSKNCSRLCYQFNGNHIRVDAAHAPHGATNAKASLSYDYTRSLFIGNLPFDVKVFSNNLGIEPEVYGILIGCLYYCSGFSFLMDYNDFSGWRTLSNIHTRAGCRSD